MGIQLNGSSGADIISSSDGTITIDGTSTVSTPIVTNTITISDKISHSGDSNTHIRFAGDDTVTVETAGSERLRIASDGHVRFGSGDPLYELELVGAGSQHILIGSTDANAATLILDGDSNGDGTGSDYATVLHSTAGNLEYHNRKTADHIFKIGTSNEEKLRITSAGFVGIGEDTPTRNLHIDGTAHQSGIIIHTAGNHSTAIDMDSNRSSAAGGLAELNFKWNGTTVGQIGAYAGSDTSNKDDGHIHFDTASAGSIVERLRITSAGLIQAKTRSAEVRRMILSGSPSNSAFNIEAHDGESGTSSGDVQGKLGLFYNDGSTLTNTACISFERGSGAPDGAMAFVTNQAERLRIYSTGQILYSAQGGDNTITSKRTNAASSNGNFFFHLKATDNNNNAVGELGFHRDTAADDSRFIVNTRNSGGSSTERLRILADGEVLIGKYAWGSNLHPNDVNKVVITGPSPSGNGAAYHNILMIEGSETSGAVDTGGALAFGGHDGNTNRNWANIWGMKENGTGSNTAGYLAFHTRNAGGNPTERIRITSTGRTYINTTSPIDGNCTVAIRGSFGASGCGVEIKHQGNQGAGRDFIRFYNINSAEAGSIEHNTSTSVQYLTSSDYRLKENIADIPDGIERLKLLKPRRFSWIDDPELGLRDGFIAHEVSPVIPHCVSGEKDAVKDNGKMQTQTMEYSQLTPLLTAALQEAIAEIETLKADVAALKSS